ncbi:beta-glucosidase BglX [Halotalea alkalilenta]|uniref:beta-glucosidase BglX n=1 Tax=Halotalea alkalilenta TaxID=376489 RepID=UPI00048A1EAA|nr:beta-glucosidase BglX [Halotalea alkalilenta]
MRKAWQLCMVVGCLALASTQLRASGGESPGEARFLDDLLARMTLEEKIGQLVLVSIGPSHPRDQVVSSIIEGKVGMMLNTVVREDIRELQRQAVEHSRLGIPLAFAFDVLHGQRTLFPIGLGLASTWDLPAIALSGRVAAREATADGLDITFAPMVDIGRDPRWGRMSEGFGEDTWLTARISETLVEAFQGDDLASPDSLMAVVKHFALYGAGEGGRDYAPAEMGRRQMREVHLPPYRAAIDVGAGGVMVALNSIDGMPATANRWLLDDLLRDEWGFRGLVISDHGAIGELISHGVAADAEQAARLAIQAGVDVDMNSEAYGPHLGGLVGRGELDPALIDRAARRVLATKYALGLFDDPYRRSGLSAEDALAFDDPSRLHRLEAREVARRSLVLLKNQRETLPLDRKARIAVVGPLAKSQADVLGSWSGAASPAQAVSLWQGLADARGGEEGLSYALGANFSDDPLVVDYLTTYSPEVKIDPRPAQVLRDEAVAAAGDADVVVAVVGESRGMSDESSSRSELDLPAAQAALVDALESTGKPLVVILMNGRPLTLERQAGQADALLETWFAGTEGGHAIADVLFGDFEPVGRLPVSFPRRVGQLPLYYALVPTGRPVDPLHPGKFTSRYFDVAGGPLFPFGFGLGYTDFSLSNPRLSSRVLPRDGRLEASVEVINQGKRRGSTVIQLYLRDPVASVTRPVRELEGFKRVTLDPGERTRVEFSIDPSMLAFYPGEGPLEAIEAGEFEVFLGQHAEDGEPLSFTLRP